MVTDELGVEIFHELVWTVIYGKTKSTQVVSVEDPMDKSITLPLGY
jgi:hypothetical protein